MSDKVAIVSGSARGLGASIAELFVREGASVLVTDVLDDLGGSTAAALCARGGRAAYQHLDVTSEADWSAAADRCRASFGAPNVLVSNAYRFDLAPILGGDRASWQASLDVNLTGHYLGFRAVLPSMIERGAGSIIAISSTSGADVAFPNQASYQVAKAGVWALTRHVAVAHGHDGVRANSIHPGPMRTAAIQSVDGLEASVDVMATSFPIPRVAEPEEVAWAAVFLASDESGYMTGSKIVVDGGSIAGLRAFPEPS